MEIIASEKLTNRSVCTCWSNQHTIMTSLFTPLFLGTSFLRIIIRFPWKISPIMNMLHTGFPVSLTSKWCLIFLRFFLLHPGFPFPFFLKSSNSGGDVNQIYSGIAGLQDPSHQMEDGEDIELNSKRII